MVISSAHGHQQTRHTGAPGLPGLVGDVEAFRAEVWGIASRVFPARFPGQLLSWQTVRSAIEDGLPADPCPDVVGEPSPMRRSAARTLRVGQPRQWHPWIEELVTALGTQLGTRVNAALFVSRPERLRRAGVLGGPGGGPRLHRHTGDHDLFVLQLDGRSHWTTQDHRAGHAVHRSSVLTPGDVLYLPAGQSYAPAVRESGSLHLVLGAAHQDAQSDADAVAAFLRRTPAAGVPGAGPAPALDERIAWLRTGLAGAMPTPPQARPGGAAPRP